MKKIIIYNNFFISLIISLLLFCSCDKDPNLSIDPKEINVEAIGGTFSVSVNSSGEWTAVVENADVNNWCSLENSSGNKNGKITIKVSENQDSLLREAIIKVSLENLTKEVKISQSGFKSEIIPLTEYTLSGSSCQWQNLNYNGQDSIIIINSDEELSNYISCTSGTYPAIDFTENTLLIASGVLSGSGLHDIESTIFRSNNLYEVNIGLIRDFTGIGGVSWEIGLIIPKSEENSTFNLNVSVIEPDNTY